MQLQQRMQSHQPQGSGTQNQIRSNGVHSDSRQYYSAPTNGHSHAHGQSNFQNDDMQPYQNAYGMGQGQPHQRQYSSNPLPPMFPSASMPPPPMAPPSGPGMVRPNSSQQHSSQHPSLYSGGPPPQLPPPGSNHQEVAPRSFSGNNGKYKFELSVEQEPQRARMCGFGDKDRRPITPPPCVRLIITDLRTGQPVPHEDIDGTFYVLQVDLWDESATREVNIVRSSSTSPAVSISAATTTSYPPTTPERPMVEYPMYTGPDGRPVYGAPQGYGMPVGHPSMPGGHPNMSYYQQPYGNAHGGSQVPYISPAQPSQSPNHTMYTRNLIGSLSVNASSLKDADDNLGFWFVLQDLSVRTEGFFRLKMNFIDVGQADGSGLNKTRAPVLAYCYSEKFQVYSAKKFPGVIESTPLSKCFAAQGIKIPIRKDVKNERDGDDDD